MAIPTPELVVRLVQEGQWWQAALTGQHLAGVPEPEAWLAQAMAWAELGLRTPAQDRLDRLVEAFPAASGRDDISALRDRISAMPEDRVPRDMLVARVRAAVAALDGRGIDLGSEEARWLATEGSVCVASDGNAIRLRPDGTIELIGDHRAAGAALVSAHADALAASPAPITIEGLDPPWLAMGIFEATRTSGYSPGIRIMQADPVEFLDGCSLADTGALLADPRVRVFVGRDALARLEAALDEDTASGCAIDGPTVPLATIRTPLPTPPARILQRAGASAERAHAADIATIRTRDQESHPAGRLSRFAEPTPSDPLRVALIAGRFTTVLRPMIDDLASSLGSLGCATRIITEPNDHSRLTPGAYSRAFAEFDPDLVVCANHTRDDMDRILGAPVMPRAVPWVTWIQDAMPHLLRPEAGASIGALDLAMGFVSPEMISGFGYPEDRTLHAEMVASDTKFAPDRIDEDLARRLRCDVAAFTNHSETPSQMRDRLIDEVSGSPGAAGVVQRIADAAIEIGSKPMASTLVGPDCRALVGSVVPDADTQTQENLVQNVAMRLVDRVYRHASLGWASEICVRRGWSFSLFGAGWETHPTLGHAARGSLAHGPELCAGYSAAGVTLNVTAFAAMHQRILECALSRGLPAVAATAGALAGARRTLARRLLREHPKSGLDVPDQPGVRVFPAYRLPDADRIRRLREMQGLRSYPYTPVHRSATSGTTRDQYAEEADADAVVGLLELGFSDAHSLETVLERAITDTAWRRVQIDRIASFARERCTHTTLATRMLRHYAERALAQTVAA